MRALGSRRWAENLLHALLGGMLGAHVVQMCAPDVLPDVLLEVRRCHTLE